MRLAVCIFKYFPYGGIQRDMMKIVDECQRRGHEIQVFTLRWEAPRPDNLAVHVLPIVGFNRHAQYERFAEDVRQWVSKERFDLVLGFNKMPGLDVYYAGDSCYLEKALTQRGALYRHLPRFKSFCRAESAVFGRTAKTQILMLSDLEMPAYRQHYQTPAERFNFLPPGIEKDRIAPPDQASVRRAFRAELGRSEDELMVVFIGSGFIKKGLDRALRAVAALPATVRERTHLYVIGKDHSEAFVRMSARLGLERQVTFFAQGRDDVPRFLFAADALVHPAYDETAGMVIIEAMLAGLPSVVTHNCGYAKYVSAHDAGIVLSAPFEQHALDAALVDILTSDRRSVWRANALAAKADSTLFALVPKAVDVLERVAASAAPLLVFVLFRYFPFGGLQRDFMRVAKAAQRRGYAILVYATEWVGEIPQGFKVILVAAAGIMNHRRMMHFARYIGDDVQWRQPAAVIGFNRMPGLDIYYAADVCFEHKARYFRGPFYRRTERYKVMSEFENAVFGASSKTHILLITDTQREQYQRHYQTPDHRLTLLPPGVNRDRMRPSNWQRLRASVRAEFALGSDDLLLLLVGSGFVTKGLDRALRMLSQLPGDLAHRTHFLVIGQDKPGRFLRQAKQLGVADRVRIVAGRNDIPAVLQAADLMVHPAYMESGGLVLIEALIAGLPVIASGACGFSHYIDQAGAGAVIEEPFDHALFTQTVVAALGDSALLERWSQRGVSFGVAHPQLYAMPAQAMAVIDEMVARRVATG